MSEKMPESGEAEIRFWQTRGLYPRFPDPASNIVMNLEPMATRKLRWQVLLAKCLVTGFFGINHSTEGVGSQAWQNDEIGGNCTKAKLPNWVSATATSFRF